MSKLIFIGLGLHDEKGITLKGLEAIKNCDKLFMESYTSLLTGTTHDRLEDLYEMPIEILDREATEKGDVILNAAQSQTVGFLVIGDTMSATTHVDLMMRAAQSGIETEIIHGVSALTAIPGLLGLQHYKFGKTTTIAFWEENYKPDSFYDVVKNNLDHGNHTLILLDIRAHDDPPRCMTATEAFEILADIEESRKDGIFADDRLVCVVARAGSPDVHVKCGKFSEMKGLDFGPPLHSIVVPGELHFMETEALENLAK